jgi:hypothetical protein
LIKYAILADHARVGSEAAPAHRTIQLDSGTAGRLDVTMIVEAEDLVGAAQKALCAVRAAIHAAGGATPGWERPVREIGAQARALLDA